ncbi:MAG: nitrate- and nitrite sensing domain-containing protein [Magnetococcales bacterium]|nr:nitrate- and nitrite sensing domain-containing protein [Magnetococcales bacterium]
MKTIGNLGIRTKLALMLTLPVLSLLYYAGSGYQQQKSLMSELERLDRLSVFSVQVGVFVHEMQKERGRTSLYLAAQGKKYATPLADQRQATDDKKAPLAASLGTFLGQLDGDDLEGVGRTIHNQLDGLKQLRDRVDQVAIPAREALSYYTTTNARLLDLVEKVSSSITRAGVGNHLISYLMLLRGKDLLGLERAETGKVLHMGEATRQDAVRLTELNASKKIYLNLYLSHADTTSREFYTTVMAADCVTQVEEIQTNLLGDHTAAFPKATASQWFDLITCKIDHLKQVEDQLVSDIKSHISDLMASTRYNFMFFIALNIGAIGLTLILVLTIAHHITSQTGQLVRTMGRFAEGALSERMGGAFRDEIGRIGLSFNKMANRIEINTEEEKKRALEDREEARRFRERVDLLRQTIARVATGDLSQRTPAQGDDELSQLGQNLNAMIESLAQMARQTEEVTQALATTLEEVQGSARAQSSGASEQAAAVNETTTTLEEIRATSTQTLEKAQTLGRMADRTRTEGEQGHLAVEESLASMREIRAKVEVIAQNILDLSEQTLRIGEITSSVNNLAQQSKMLALNAAIEAAKAGEAGKGFGVVAEEVKNLAEQSQQFTTQVHRILEEIRHATDKAVMATEEGSKEVDQGVIRMEQTGTSVRSLSEVIRETAMAGQQIVAAVRQEATGIDQISTAMTEINKVTQQFVSATQQAVQATTDLGNLSGKLKESIRFYKV